MDDIRTNLIESYDFLITSVSSVDNSLILFSISNASSPLKPISRLTHLTNINIYNPPVINIPSLKFILCKYSPKHLKFLKIVKNKVAPL